MTKPLHVARASENGVFAAELAAKGFTGGDDGLDGQWGFFQVFGGGADLDRLVPVLGKPYTIISPGVSIKPYPCGSLSHPSLDAMLKVVVDHDLKPEQIRAVRLRRLEHPRSAPVQDREDRARGEVLHSVPVEQHHPPPQSRHPRVHRRVRGQRAGAADDAARDRRLRREDRSAGLRQDPQHRRSRSVDGRTLVQPSDDRYRGGPDNPFTREELHAKFADCAQLVLSARARAASPRAQLPRIDRRVEGHPAAGPDLLSSEFLFAFSARTGHRRYPPGGD